MNAGLCLELCKVSFVFVNFKPWDFSYLDIDAHVLSEEGNPIASVRSKELVLKLWSDPLHRSMVPPANVRMLLLSSTAPFNAIFVCYNCSKAPYFWCKYPFVVRIFNTYTSILTATFAFSRIHQTS